MSKKEILVVGSDSRIISSFISKSIAIGDNLTTISRNNNSNHKSAEHLKADLSDKNAIENLAKILSSKKFDVFIYTPAIFNPKKISDLRPEEINYELTLNLTAGVILCAAVVKNMILKKSGKLIFIGSSSSYFGFKNTSIYCASKHGLLGFTKSIAEELREYGIKVSCISPGTVDTKMSEPLLINNKKSDFIDPDEISNLIFNLINNPPFSMWQEEIILKRLNY